MKSIEAYDRIEITDECLRLVGFKRYKTVIVDTHNYIKGDFKMNTALPFRFFYKGELIPHKIKYMDELIAIYIEKTGQHIIKLNDENNKINENQGGY